MNENDEVLLEATGVYKIYKSGSGLSAVETVALKGVNLKDPRLEQWSRSLQLIKDEGPEFYSSIFRLETDKIHTVKMTLRNGAVIYWGELEPQRTMVKVTNIQKLLDRYRPTKSGAKLTVVAPDRIVMNKKWTKI